MPTVEVRSPELRDEAIAVLRLLASLAVLAALVIGARTSPEEGGPRSGDLFPYQVSYRSLSTQDRRMFGQVGEGLTEAIYARAADGRWLSVRSLASAGIPPFAPHPLDRGSYTWTLEVDGFRVRYVAATVGDTERSPFLITIREPDPENPDLTHRTMQVLDELHRRLDDGAILDVSIWTRSGTAEFPRPIADDPSTQGWSQVLLRAPGSPFR